MMESSDKENIDPGLAIQQKTTVVSVSVTYLNGLGGSTSGDGSEIHTNGHEGGCVPEPEFRRSRGQKRKPESWSTNINKKRRMEGKKYEAVKLDKSSNKKVKVVRPGRFLRERCRCKSKNLTHCDQFSDSERQELFNNCWRSFKDWEHRKVHIMSFIQVKEPKRCKTSLMNRNRTLVYNLYKNGEIKRVCKTMFLATLDLHQDEIYSWMKPKVPKNSSSSQQKEREKYKEGEKRKNMESFLLLLPKVKSHYCRRRSKMNYLEPLFKSKADLYRSFKQYCKDKNIVPASRFVLTNLLKKLRISFYIPKKDQCNVCREHELDKSNVEKAKKYDLHIKRKNEINNEKITDKKNCKQNTCSVITVDVQQVLLSPRLNVNASYFKQKLSCHNYTVYNLQNAHVTCYFWNETEGEVKATNFASCLVNYLEENFGHNEGKSIIIYSDGCPAQNRNCTLSIALSQYSMKFNVTLYQKFLEKGHTYMEVDSVHGCIEKKLKNEQINVPTDYKTVIENSRLNNPYGFKDVPHTFFTNYENLTNFCYNDIRPGKRSGDACVTDIRLLKYDPDGKIHYKLNVCDNFVELPNKSKYESKVVPFPKMYNSRIAISNAKWKDLQELKVFIPEPLRSFYDNIPQGKKLLKQSNKK